MKTYSISNFDPKAYAEEISRSLHDPFLTALVEIRWNGTREYQTMIERDGLEKQQSVLQKIRETIGIFTKGIKEIEKRCQELSAKGQACRRKAGELGDVVSYRDAQGRPATRDNSGRITNMRAQEKALTDDWTKEKKLLALARSDLAHYKLLDELLSAALLMYRNEDAKRRAIPATLPAPPVFNITNRVEAPIVNLEANLPAPEITVNLPARKTATQIIRDKAGNITSATQIETTA
jgi:hypothetical protein